MPFMEYAGSYALYNYRLEEPSRGLEYDNIRLIRAFEHGLDPTSSEAGFVLVHIDMVRNSGPLVAATVRCLDEASKAAAGLGSVEGRKSFNQGLSDIVTAMKKINAVMETMWGKSRPRDYTSFRTFIFGITAQSMFPNGVVYESLYDNKPMSFRGESGANDSMVAEFVFWTNQMCSMMINVLGVFGNRCTAKAKRVRRFRRKCLLRGSKGQTSQAPTSVLVRKFQSFFNYQLTRYNTNIEPI